MKVLLSVGPVFGLGSCSRFCQIGRKPSLISPIFGATGLAGWAVWVASTIADDDDWFYLATASPPSLVVNSLVHKQQIPRRFSFSAFARSNPLSFYLVKIDLLFPSVKEFNRIIDMCDPYHSKSPLFIQRATGGGAAMGFSRDPAKLSLSLSLSRIGERNLWKSENV